MVAKHDGRVFKVTGDGVLVEFGSAVNAVQCAVDLQHAMAAANGDQPNDRHIVLRIGINLGDVMVEGSDLYGEGINIAARLETLADPAGIFVSGSAYDQVRNKVKIVFEDLGAQTLKNISQPVRTYRIIGTPSATAPGLKDTAKPSIAVLPFTNMSGEPEQEYFSDGITEDIITELSRFRSLFVIARNSSFQYKGKNVDVRRIARELGVQFLVEGSVRKMGDRIRITAQLIDTATGNHLWSERYDRALSEIFVIQDEVLLSIVARVEGRLVASVAEQAKRKPPEQLAAFDCVLRARNHINTYDTESAEPLLQHAIELDPRYAQAYVWLAITSYVKYFSEPKRELLDKALTLARQAVEIDPDDALCHSTVAVILTLRQEYEEAGTSFDRALTLNPSDTFVMVDHAYWQCTVGSNSEALERLDSVLKRDPFPPGWYWGVLAQPLFALGRYEEAVQSVRRMDRPYHFDYALMAACLAQLGRTDESLTTISKSLSLHPSFTIREFLLTYPRKHQADTDHLEKSLRKAGLPE